MDRKTPILPPHIEETIQSIAKFHADHYSQATPLQSTIDRITLFIAQPRFVAGLTVVLILWMGGNTLAPVLGWTAIDPPPFDGLTLVLAIAGLYVAMLILVTQRREDQLAQYREQLTLQLAILSEQKSAKIIELLETLRNDHPAIKNRVDEKALEMSTPADPQIVLDAIKQTHREEFAAAHRGDAKSADK